MGEVVNLVPKALVDFEKRALKLVAQSSRLMVDMPATIRSAKTLGQVALVERLERLVVPLTALADAVGILEEAAPTIVDAVEPFEQVVIHVENVGPDHTILCHSTVRENVIYISDFEFRRREWLDRLMQSPPRVLIEHHAGA